MRKMSVIAAVMICASLTSHAGSEITVMLGQSFTNIKWMKQMKEDYEKKYPDRKVNLNAISGKEADRATKAALMLRDNDKIDVFLEDSAFLKSDVNAGLIVNLPVEKWSDWDKFYPGFREFTTLDGRCYGIPLGTDVRGIYYHVEYLRNAGLPDPWQPKNWNDILDAAKKIKARYPDIIPFASPVAATGEATAMQGLEMLLYGTDNTLYEKGKWIVKSPGFLDSLKFINTIYRDGLGPDLAIATNAQYTTKAAYELVPKQKVAMLLDGSWLMGVWQEKYKDVLNHYKLAAMPTQNGQKPGFTTMCGGWLICINSKSRKKDEAFEFIKFAVSQQGSMKYTLLTNSFTTRTDVVNLPDYPKLLKQYAYFVDFGHFRPADEKYPVVSAFIQKAVDSVATGQVAPEAAMDQYASSVTKAVGEANVTTVK